MGEAQMGEEMYVGHLLKKKSADSQTEPAPLGEAGLDHQELQSIVNNLVKLPAEQPVPKASKIARITHHEISAMRVTQSNMPAAKTEQKARGSASALIQTFDAFMGLFKHPDKRSRCLIDGHECKHCGQIVKSQPEKVGDSPRGH